MILYNPAADSLDADFHSVPTAHLDEQAGAAIKAYLASAAKPTAALSAAAATTVEAPSAAPFSSAGPSVSSGGDLLKPDIVGPGVDIARRGRAAGPRRQNFDFESGTSMATPHLAGVAALLKSAHPDWSPMAVKSALMTTAGNLDNQGRPIQRGDAAATPLDVGAGQVRPAAAFDPGLVYDSGPMDWLRYACGIDVHLLVGAPPGQDVCPIAGTRDPSDLNYPSLAVGDLAGAQTLTRTVTNVSDRTSTYLASVTPPPGVRVSVSPKSFVLAPGRSATYRVTLARITARYDTWAFGSLTWLDLHGHAVHSPIAVQPVAVAAPTAAMLAGAAGSTGLAVRTGYSGTLTAVPYGLTAATIVERTLTGTTTTFDASDPAAGPAVAKIRVSVPDGTAIARVATYAADYGQGADLDLYAYRPDGTLVGQSGSSTADESVDLPGPGDYDVYAVQFALPDGVDRQTVRLNTFAVPSRAAGNLTVTPHSQPVRFGGRVQVTVHWSGLVTGRHYLGQIAYRDGYATRATTTVAADG